MRPGGSSGLDTPLRLLILKLPQLNLFAVLQSGSTTAPLFLTQKANHTILSKLENNLAPPVNYNIPIIQYYCKRVTFNVRVFLVVKMNVGSVDRRR